MATIQERTGRDGKPSYRVIVRISGFPSQTATFSRKTDAKHWAARTETEIRERRHFPVAAASRHTLAEAIDRYIEDVLPTKPRSFQTQSGQLNWWRDELGDYRLSALSPDVIASGRDKRAKTPHARGKKPSPATVNRYMAALSHVLSVARDEWAWLAANPMSRVRKLKEPNGRVRFLDDDERRRLLEACKASKNLHLYTIVVLAISTGMRRSEITDLTWKQVNLKRGHIVLEKTKNDERRGIPLSGVALDLFRATAKKRDKQVPWVFPNGRGDGPVDIKTAWETAVRRAELEDFRFHDLRHSAASYLAMNGATPSEIADVLGHKSLEMVKRYAHLSEQHTADVVARMNKKILGRLEDETSS